jgi:predicted methyltransferase
MDTPADRDDRPRSRTVVRAVSALLAAGIIGLLAFAMRTSARDAAEAERLVATLGIVAGSHVADIGAGNGAFTLALSKVVGPAGRVFATEIDPGRLEDLRRTVAREAATNVEVVTATETNSGLPPACCDALLLRRVVHHFTRPEETLATLFRAARPGARVAVVDFEPGGTLWPSPEGVPRNRHGHGVGREAVMEEFVRAGFHLLQEDAKWSGRDYLILFRK